MARAANNTTSPSNLVDVEAPVAVLHVGPEVLRGQKVPDLGRGPALDLLHDARVAADHLEDVVQLHLGVLDLVLHVDELLFEVVALVLRHIIVVVFAAAAAAAALEGPRLDHNAEAAQTLVEVRLLLGQPPVLVLELLVVPERKKPQEAA